MPYPHRSVTIQPGNRAVDASGGLRFLPGGPWHTGGNIPADQRRRRQRPRRRVAQHIERSEAALPVDQTAILTIEDDADIRQLLHTVLGREGYTVSEAATGREGLRTFHQTRPDLVILDLGLPDLDGWQVLERIRDMSDAPVLVLTARSSELDKVRGLNAGADDYLTKPFSHVELLARLHAIRRRRVTTPPVQATFDDGRIKIDFLHQQAYLHDDPVPLTPTEYRLLCAFVRHAGQILSADQLIELAWDDPSGLGPARVKYAVLRLRRKLGWDDTEDSPLETVRGFGYRY